MADAVDTPKNCPWCGSSARVNQPMKDADYWVVECTGDIDEVSGCFAEFPYIAGYDTKEKAVKAWNTRPAESALAAERDENKKAANAFKAMWEDAERERDELEGDIRSLEHELAAANERAEKAEEELKSLRAQPYTFTADSARMK